MTSSPARYENANAEILGVVILIGIFAITAGIISATVISQPATEEVPAASIEITEASANSIRLQHLGGDPLPVVPPENLVVRYADGGGGIHETPVETWLAGDLGGAPAIENGFTGVGDATDWVAAAIVYTGASSESVIASWDPDGIYGPLGPSTPDGGSIPSPPPTPVAPQPTVPFPSTVQNITADFVANVSAVGLGEEVEFRDMSIGNVTIDAWAWEFGDGSTSTLQNPVHSYGLIGNYTVTLTASNLTTGQNGTVVKTGCIQVSVLPGPVDFDVTATQGSVALTVVCTDISASSPSLWRWTARDGLNLSVLTVGLDNTPVGLNDSYDPRVQVFEFYNPAGTVVNDCSIMLEVWSPYFASPIAVTKHVTVEPPLQAEFRTNLTDGNGWLGTAGVDGAQVLFQDLSVGAPTNWSWDFGDGSTSTEQHPAHVFTVGPDEIRNFTVTLTASGWGQEHTVAHDVQIYPAVSARSQASPTQGSAPLTVAFTDLSTGDPDHWLWDFGDEYNLTDSTEQNPVHTFTNDGTYTVTLFAERSEPHSVAPQSSTILILVGDEVIADFIGSPRTGDFPLDVQFTDLSINATSGSWTFGDGGTWLYPPDDQHPLWTYYEPGNYTVSLTADSIYRSDTETKVEYISVTGPITASFTASDNSVENNTSVQFTDTSDGNPYTFAWDFGDGTTSTERNPLHVYTKPGVYDVTLTASNPVPHTDTHTETGFITVYDKITASLIANPDRGLAPLPVQFNDTSTGAPTSWSWDFGDGSTSTEQHPVHTYIDPGTYPVTLTASHAYDSQTTTTYNCVVLVFGDLGALFETNQTDGPGPLTVQFTDTSQGNPISWSWDFGDGETSTERHPVHTFDESGSYSVVLTVGHLPDMTKVSEAHPITVYDPLEAEFTVNETDGMAPFTVQFTRGSIGGGNSWRWDFGDTTTSTEQDPVHTYGLAGRYNATLTVWNDLREDLTFTSVPQTLTGYVVPLASFSASPPTGLAPLTVRFTDTSANNPTSWSWDFGDGTTSTERNPVHTFMNAGAYTVTLRVANAAGDGPAPASRPITVIGSDVPVASFGSNVTGGLAPLAVQFTDTSTNSPTSWSWDFGDGTTSTERNPVHTFMNAGAYTVTLRVANPAGDGLAPATRIIRAT